FAEQTARADADSALAQDIQTLATQIGNAEAVVQQTSEALAELDGSVKANWQVKTQVRADGKVVQAGVGLGASIGADGQVRSEFLVMADTIGFLNTVNGEIHAPFVFDTVNDTAFLNAAIIGDATISFAKIQNDIQSENYVAGETGWKINKNGDVEFSDGRFRGEIYAESGELNNVIINEDCEVLGKLSADQIIGDLVSSGVIQLNKQKTSSRSWVTLGTKTGVNNNPYVANILVNPCVFELTAGSGQAAVSQCRVLINGSVAGISYTNIPADNLGRTISFCGPTAVTQLQPNQSFSISVQVIFFGPSPTSGGVKAASDTSAQLFRQGSAFN
ncbi:DUF1983 domain-containing protein, partial [Vibrio metschnikovii]|nr:DUF1983 domain-containing protein [Vibrio metschnikovii]